MVFGHFSPLWDIHAIFVAPQVPSDAQEKQENDGDEAAFTDKNQSPLVCDAETPSEENRESKESESQPSMVIEVEVHSLVRIVCDNTREISSSLDLQSDIVGSVSIQNEPYILLLTGRTTIESLAVNIVRAQNKSIDRAPSTSETFNVLQKFMAKIDLHQSEFLQEPAHSLLTVDLEVGGITLTVSAEILHLLMHRVLPIFCPEDPDGAKSEKESNAEARVQHIADDAMQHTSSFGVQTISGRLVLTSHPVTSYLLHFQAG